MSARSFSWSTSWSRHSSGRSSESRTSGPSSPAPRAARERARRVAALMMRAFLCRCPSPARSRPSAAAIDQAVLLREADCGGAVRHAELPVDVAEVELDGLLGDPQLLADRLVREPAHHGLEDHALALRQIALILDLRDLGPRRRAVHGLLG